MASLPSLPAVATVALLPLPLSPSTVALLLLPLSPSCHHHCHLPAITTATLLPLLLCTTVTSLEWSKPLTIVKYPDPRLRAVNAKVGGAPHSFPTASSQTSQLHRSFLTASCKSRTASSQLNLARRFPACSGPSHWLSWESIWSICHSGALQTEPRA